MSACSSDVESTIQQSRALHEGYLQKLGSNSHRARRRYCVLKPMTLLFYFFNEGDADPRGCIDVDEFYDVSVVPGSSEKCFVLKRPATESTNADSFTFEAKDAEECTKWVDLIRFSRYSVYANDFQQWKKRCFELEKELSKCRQEIDTLSHYANQRHQTSLMLRDERERRKEIMLKLMKLCDLQVLKGIPDRNCSSLGSAESSEADHKKALEVIDKAHDHIISLENQKRAIEKDSQEIRQRLDQQRLHIERLESEYQSLSTTHSSSIVKLRGANATISALRAAKLEVDSELQLTRSKLQAAKRERRVLASELRNFRSSPHQAQNGQKTDDSRSDDIPGASPMRPAVERSLLDDLTVRRSVLPLLNLDDEAASRSPTETLTDQDVSLASLSSESYDLRFDSQKIGLQLEETSSNGRRRFFIVGREGYANATNDRPRIGSELISFNGMSVGNIPFDELAIQMREADRPLFLRFVERAST